MTDRQWTGSDLHRPSRICTEIAPGLLYACTALYKISVVNVRDHRDNSPEPFSSQVFSPSDGQGGHAPEARELKGFRVSGRCFVVVYPEGSRSAAYGALTRRIPGRGSATYTSDPAAGLSGQQARQVGVAPSHHHKASSGPKRRIDASTCPHVVGALHESDGAFSAPAPAALSQGPQRTGIADRHAIGPRLTGAWKWNVDAQRAVVSQQSGDGREEPSGASGLTIPEISTTGTVPQLWNK